MNFKLIIVAVLLMLLAMLVLGLVLLEGNKKSKKKKKETGAAGVPAKTPEVPVQPLRQPVVQAAEQSAANPGSGRIYAYTRHNSVRICPGCEGENPPSRSRCMICGCEMTPMRR